MQTVAEDFRLTAAVQASSAAAVVCLGSGSADAAVEMYGAVCRLLDRRPDLYTAVRSPCDSVKPWVCCQLPGVCVKLNCWFSSAHATPWPAGSPRRSVCPPLHLMQTGCRMDGCRCTAAGTGRFCAAKRCTRRLAVCWLAIVHHVIYTCVNNTIT